MSDKLLTSINYPSDLRLLDEANFHSLLKNYAIYHRRCFCKERTSRRSLGVIELTIALHYVFNTPDDLLIWDVGHQAYGHKILTGRR
jgi:1-deoxy-D-xylulose-5-phosphate synthase